MSINRSKYSAEEKYESLKAFADGIDGLRESKTWNKPDLSIWQQKLIGNYSK